MKYCYLLFDFDNTLVDFTTTAKRALEQTFIDFGATCDTAVHDAYRSINHQVWTAFERGEMTAERLRTERFELLFERLGYTPATAAVFSKRFLEHLVTFSIAYDGVPELLETLSRKYQLGIVTNGLQEVQRPRLDLLRLRDYFQTVVVSDEIGVAKPHKGFFTHAYAQITPAVPKAKILVIGDNLRSDIVGGRAFGCATCWVSHGRTNETDIRPDYTIDHVGELPDLLDQCR